MGGAHARPDRARRRSWIGFGLGLVGLIPVLWAATDSLNRPFFKGHARGVKSDFALDYAFAKIGLDSGWSHLYNLHDQALAYARTSPGLKYFPLPYPPPVGWLAAPFTLVSVATAYRVFEIVCVVLFLGSGWLFTTGRWVAFPWRAIAVLAPLTVFPIAFCVVLGQVVVVQLFGVALAYWAWRRHRDVLAGLALVTLLLHPQCLLLVPLVPLLLRRWRTVIAAAGAGAVVGLICVVQLGPSGVHAFLQRISLTQREPLVFDVVPGLSPVLTWTDPLARVAVVAAVLLLVAWTVVRSGDENIEVGLAAALIGSLLLAPFIHINDLIILAPSGWLLLRRRTAWLGPIALVVLVILSFGAPGYGPDWEHLVFVAEFAWLVAIAISASKARTPGSISIHRQFRSVPR